jgi:hypothetical protein
MFHPGSAFGQILFFSPSQEQGIFGQRMMWIRLRVLSSAGDPTFSPGVF